MTNKIDIDKVDGIDNVDNSEKETFTKDQVKQVLKNVTTKESLQEMLKDAITERDKQMDLLKTNSAFIWAIIVACFGVLAYCLDKNINENNGIIYVIISLAGLLASIIWTWTLRASKAKYEGHEIVQWKIQTYMHLKGYLPLPFFQNAIKEKEATDIDKNIKKEIEEFNKVNKIEEGETKDLLNKFYKNSIKGDTFLNAKPFSPTKILILTSYLLQLVWVLILSYYTKEIWNNNECFIIILFVILLLAILILRFTFIMTGYNHFKFKDINKDKKIKYTKEHLGKVFENDLLKDLDIKNEKDFYKRFKCLCKRNYFKIVDFIETNIKLDNNNPNEANNGENN